MKHSSIAALLVASALLAVGCGDDDSPVGSESATYEVELPEGWSEASESEQQQAAEQVGAVVEGAAPEGSKFEGIAVTSLWGEDLSDQEGTNVIVIREPVPNGFTFDEFVDLSISNVKSLFGDALTSDVAEADPIEIDGEEHPTYEYDAEIAGTPSSKKVVFISRDDGAYTLTLNATPEAFDDGVADLGEIAASWEWTDG